ncbi:MAG: nucleotidyltransferase family protein, partial [Firmicutes bacterium]|nr:nucleotidyltransferase family protein [Bacillota bacterium]
MKNTAVIAEYNPFHNGHKFHLEKTRELTGCENIIAVMSGNFTQRGEPAVFEKHIRVRHALENGADMVLELPVEYAAGAA